MTRQLITALILAVTSTLAVSDVQADCGGHRCHSSYGFGGFHARFGCSPKEAFFLFQKHPELITRFPETARSLQTEFGTFATPAAPATGPAAAIATDGVAPIDPAAAATAPPAAGTAPPAAEAAPPAGAAPPAEAPPAGPALDAAPGAAATEPVAVTAPAAGGEVSAPNAAAATADPAAPPADLPTAAPIQPELEPLLGLWVNENDAADQPIAKINLAGDGNATITVNTPVGQADVKKPFAIADDTFKLDGNDLAKVVSADANRVVLDANGTNLTFVRP